MTTEETKTQADYDLVDESNMQTELYRERMRRKWRDLK